MRNFLLVISLLLAHSTLSAGIFSWIDSSGNLVYGDNPPDIAVAKPVAPPKLTVLENFANRYEDPKKSSSRRSLGSSGAEKARSGFSFTSKTTKRKYSDVSIIAPKANQSIRANDGDVSIAASTSPKLQSGDQVVMYLNGQEQVRGKSRVANLSNLDRGEYKLVVEIQSAEGESLIKSSEISFNVLRNSVITNKTKPYSPYEEDPSQ